MYVAKQIFQHPPTLRIHPRTTAKPQPRKTLHRLILPDDLACRAARTAHTCCLKAAPRGPSTGSANRPANLTRNTRGTVWETRGGGFASWTSPFLKYTKSGMHVVREGAFSAAPATMGCNFIQRRCTAPPPKGGREYTRAPALNIQSIVVFVVGESKREGGINCHQSLPVRGNQATDIYCSFNYAARNKCQVVGGTKGFGRKTGDVRSIYANCPIP